MSMSKVTPIGRASFPNLSKPDQYNKYSLSILFPKSDPKVMEFARWLKEAVTTEAIAIAGKAHLAEAMSHFSNFRDGDDVGAFKTYRSEYAGHFVLNVSRKTDFGKPCVVNRNKQPIEPSEIYAGCNVLAYIDVFGDKFGAKKSVSVGVQHVMKTGENTSFSAAGTKVDDAFGDLDIPDEGEVQQDAMPSTATPVATPPVQKAKFASDPFAGV